MEDMQRLSQGMTSILSKGVFSVEETVRHLQTALTRSIRFQSASHQLVQKALGYFHSHYTEDVSRDGMAHHLSVNSDYLTRSFTQTVGISPVVYLHRYRIQQAKLLLATTACTIGEIAAMVGFGDYAQFSRIFRRQIGVSPREYRGQSTREMGE